MPPGRHSSSSHSSHSRSSSHHSSSHRSSPSRHSYSSHSSRSSYSSSARSHSASRSYVRTRINQPTGWNEAVHGKTLSFNLKLHDYVYYPHSWVNEQGVQYNEGYYDENGQYYANMVAKGVQTNLLCKYCGNHMVYTWNDGMIPTCDKCGGVFQIDLQDSQKKKKMGVGIKILVAVGLLYLLAIPTFGLTLLFALFRGVVSDRASVYPDRTVVAESTADTVADTNSYGLPKSIYVKEIGRKCYPDGENMYDLTSDCWFWFNTDLLPAQWQYWYEGISSDFGDYGWMEYSDDEGKWYIEVSEGNWQELTGYDTGNLWHFTDAYVNEYY